MCACLFSSHTERPRSKTPLRACALHRAIDESRSLDVCVMRVQVNKECVRYSVGLLNDAIKIKGTEESRSLPYRFDKN